MCTKYRRKVLQGEIDERLKYWVREVFAHFGLEFSNKKRIRIICTSCLACSGVWFSVAVRELVEVHHGRRLRQEFPREVRCEARPFGPGRILWPALKVRLEDVKRYVETQKDK